MKPILGVEEATWKGCAFPNAGGSHPTLPCVPSPGGLAHQQRAGGVPEVPIHQKGLFSPEWGSLWSWLVPGTLWHEADGLPVSSGVLLRA